MPPHALKYYSHLYFLESVLGPKILDRKTTGVSLFLKQNKTLILGPKVSLSFTEVKVLFYLKGKKMLRFMVLHSNNVICLLK